MVNQTDDGMMAVFGANVAQFGDEVSIHTSSIDHMRNALLEDKGFNNDWHKVYLQEN